MATTMTEIPIKDLALTTASAGKQLLVRDASAGLQRIDYDQIAKNLVESYGSSSLAGKNQSIKAAIDSLNSGLTQCNTNISSLNNSLTQKLSSSLVQQIANPNNQNTLYETYGASIIISLISYGDNSKPKPPGYPKDAYPWGLLVTFNYNNTTLQASLQIYTPDSRAALQHLYYRNSAISNSQQVCINNGAIVNPT